MIYKLRAKKGFTMVELLAVVVILGVIIGISIPLVRRMQEANKKKQFSTYFDSVKTSTKLYMDSNEIDLFGDAKSGCSTVTFKTLNNKGLLKDIALDDVTCATDGTYTRIVKVNDHYGYSTHVLCKKRNSNVIEYEQGKNNESVCSISDDNVIDVIIKDKEAIYVQQWNDIEVVLSSSTGIYPDNVSIQYAFSTTKEESGLVDTWSPLKITVPSEDEQYTIIERGETVSVTGFASTPKGYTGEIYMLVKVLYLRDLVLDNWIDLEDDRGEPLVSNNKYLLDNIKPTGNITSTNNVAVKQTVTLTMNDDKVLNKYYFGTSNPANSNVSYTTISGKVKTKTVTADANTGATYYLRVYDQANNYFDISKVFYNTTLDKDGGTGIISNVITLKDNSFTVPIPTRSGYSFSGWYTAKNGGGVQITPAQSGIYKPMANATLYAKWTGCGPGTYSNNNQCVSCPSNTYSSEAANRSCTACPTGMNSEAGSKAKTACKISCGAGKYLAKSGTSCSTCPVGSYCAGGTYNYNEGSNQGIVACPTGMTSDAGSSVKTNCKINCGAGKYLAKNETSCATCVAGNYCGGGTYHFNTVSNQGITACPTGMTSDAGSSVKTNCKINCGAGTYLAQNGTSCAICPANSYCAGGTYNFNTSSNQGVTACPSGMNSAAGSSKKTDCKITCAAGKYLAANGTSCATCPANSYCAGGTYNFNTSSNQGVTACPSGMTSNAGSSVKTNCKRACAAGTYLAANASNCASCPANYYCLGGTYNFNPNSNQGNTACPSGYISGGGSRAKSNCFISCPANTRVTGADGKCTGGCNYGYSIGTHNVNAGSVSPACSAITSYVSLDQQGGSGGTGGVNATYASAMPSITVPTRRYTVTYNYNSGEGSTSTYSFSSGGGSTSSDTAYYTFDGYYSGTNGGGTKYYNASGTSATNWNLATGATLYAKWSDSVNVYSNGGNDCGGTGCWCGCCNSCRSVPYEIITNRVKLPNASRSDHSFNGWYTEASGGTRVGGNGDYYYPSSNITLYAQWTYTPPPSSDGGGGGGGDADDCGGTGCWCGCCNSCGAEACGGPC